MRYNVLISGVCYNQCRIIVVIKKIIIINKIEAEQVMGITLSSLSFLAVVEFCQRQMSKASKWSLDNKLNGKKW